MIKEDYVSFETAKLLKEKGFDEICRKFYKCWPTNPKLYCCDKSQMFDYCTNSSLSKFNYVGDEMNIAAPTHQMAMKWLREVHNIFIVIEPHAYDYINEKNSSCVFSIWQGDNYCENPLLKDYPTYEQTVESAIKYCLENLI